MADLFREEYLGERQPCSWAGEFKVGAWHASQEDPVTGKDRDAEKNLVAMSALIVRRHLSLLSSFETQHFFVPRL